MRQATAKRPEASARRVPNRPARPLVMPDEGAAQPVPVQLGPHSKSFESARYYGDGTALLECFR